jgi:hypothetical protein
LDVFSSQKDALSGKLICSSRVSQAVRGVSLLLLACACQSHDPSGSSRLIPSAASASPAASFAVNATSPRPSSTPSAPATADALWDDALVKLAGPWTAAHRAALWKIVERLPQQLQDIDDRGCAPPLRPHERLGVAFARQRREARTSKHYREDVRCVPYQNNYECSIGFGLDGTTDDQDYTLSVSLRVRHDGTPLDSRVVCYLAG